MCNLPTDRLTRHTCLSVNTPSLTRCGGRLGLPPVVLAPRLWSNARHSSFNTLREWLTGYTMMQQKGLRWYSAWPFRRLDYRESRCEAHSKFSRSPGTGFEHYLILVCRVQTLWRYDSRCPGPASSSIFLSWPSNR